MEIYNYINSKDIQAHWEKINYVPTAVESTWLVWQSKNTTMRERHSAWKYLIDSTPDCAIPAGLHNIPQENLHKFLKRYMEIEAQLVSAFYLDEPNTVYSYRFYCEGDSNWCDDRSLFRSFNEVYAYAKEDFDDLSPKFVEFSKTYIGAEGKQILIRFNLENEILRVDENHYITDEEDEIFRTVFDGMWFAFPTPFKKGDLVRTTHGKYRKPSYMAGTFVLTSICTEYRSGGDGNDMTAHGYFIGGMGEVYHECIHNYMDLEYLRDELQNEERLLIPISRYLKDEIDLGLLLGAYRNILCKNEANEVYLSLNYTKEGKELAGMGK